MYRSNPSLYKTDRCARCQAATETSGHVWECPAAEDEVRAVTAELARGLAALVEKGDNPSVRWMDPHSWMQLPWLTYPLPPPPPPPPTTAAAGEVVSGELNLGHTFRGLVAMQAKDILTCCGVKSDAALTGIVQCYHKFLLAAHDRIWKRRCEDTIEWEKRHHITRAAKTKKKNRQQLQQHQQQDFRHSEATSSLSSSSSFSGNGRRRMGSWNRLVTKTKSALTSLLKGKQPLRPTATSPPPPHPPPPHNPQSASHPTTHGPHSTNNQHRTKSTTQCSFCNKKHQGPCKPLATKVSAIWGNIYTGLEPAPPGTLTINRQAVETPPITNSNITKRK
jgi:hypothetical protein